jgi:hypothetical protein
LIDLLLPKDGQAVMATLQAADSTRVSDHAMSGRVCGVGFVKACSRGASGVHRRPFEPHVLTTASRLIKSRPPELAAGGHRRSGQGPASAVM